MAGERCAGLSNMETSEARDVDLICQGGMEAKHQIGCTPEPHYLKELSGCWSELLTVVRETPVTSYLFSLIEVSTLNLRLASLQMKQAYRERKSFQR